LDKGEHVDSAKAKESFGVYAERWLTRLNVRPSTAALYEMHYRIHLKPTFAAMEFRHMDTEAVRTWHAKLLRTNRLRSTRRLSPATCAKVYRLLRQMCEDAVDDGYLRANPCRIKKAATEKVPERLYKEPPTAAQVRTLATAVPARFRAMVLLAGFGGLRWGELAGLQRHHVDLEGRTVRVVQQLTELNGVLAIGEPKTAAGVRTVHLHSELVEALRVHLAQYVSDRTTAYVFTDTNGEWLRASNFRRRVWLGATTAAECPGLRFHDLRHAAATLATDTGASTKDLMARMGHASPAAALRYQHAREDKQRAIADALDIALAPAANVVALRR
jgi:integrase